MDGYGMLLNFLVLVILFPYCHPIDDITTDRSLTDGNTLVSRNGTFALGFFSPGNSIYKYLGIWYHKLPEQTVVWVANRNSPVNDSSGILSISRDGNLVLYDHHDRNLSLWSANVSTGRTDGYVAQLLDSGNLVVVHNESNQIVWQSFDHPTDTMLPGLKIGLDRKLGLYKSLTSWRSANDPGTGDMSYKLNPNGCPQFFLRKGLTRIWRSSPWPWDPAPMPGYLPTSANNEDEIFYTFQVEDEFLSRIVVKSNGMIQRLTWDNSSFQWRVSRSEPKYIYGHCGVYSILNSNNLDSLECMCLPGYEPKSLKNWYLRDGSAGCVRKRQKTTSVCGNGEGFIKVERVKIPDTSIATLLNKSLSSIECQQMCFRNCSCKAFTSLDIERKGYGCLMWYGELMDTVEYTEGRDMFVRVDAIELAEEARKRGGFLKRNGMLVIPVSSAFLNILLIVIFVNWWLKKKRKRKVKKKLTEGLLSTSVSSKLDESCQTSDVPFFDLFIVYTATNNLSPANKLGQGGFGPVYKGQLKDGRYIAVKRLSQSSGQGIEEFKNEVLLLARLQHRNLVKLLGCCIEGDERMLIYEYLPNKSLDYFIFDQKASVLNWRKRLDIIVGIARGVLYLHHDSRLRIIHRDLKSSNVLLDAEMNPKISDFGIARICDGDEIQVKTKRVIGTHGYMAPEYALFGKFSTKSDVFSFGVIVLETISGKKCNNFFPEDPSLHLIGHVWDLWRQDKVLDIIDSSLMESLESDVLPQIFRYIQIGLLCVQNNEMDRPSMSTVLLMLNSETTLPYPQEPAFILGSNYKGFIPSNTAQNYSLNQVTITQFEAR
ncbi:G-type lectin S-receptor-like serine/threonine-protein kinase RKS1 isoform X2 [Euphorbia lathyris]